MKWMRIAALLLVAAGCNKKEEDKTGASPPLPPTEPIAVGEAELGRKACTAYVAQVCDCATKRAEMPELKEECEMARARPDAFELNVRAAMAEGDATSKDRRILTANSRKIMRACIEDSAALVKKGCPLSQSAELEPAPGK